MRERRHGRIVVISSRPPWAVARRVAMRHPGGAAGDGQTLAGENAAHGIPSTILQPGGHRAGHGVPPRVRERVIAGLPAGRPVEPRRIAAAVAFRRPRRRPDHRTVAPRRRRRLAGQITLGSARGLAHPACDQAAAIGHVASRNPPNSDRLYCRAWISSALCPSHHRPRIASARHWGSARALSRCSEPSILQSGGGAPSVATGGSHAPGGPGMTWPARPRSSDP
jgi:hypothetical protein